MDRLSMQIQPTIGNKRKTDPKISESYNSCLMLELRVLVCIGRSGTLRVSILS